MKRILIPLVILLAGCSTLAGPVCAPWGDCIDVSPPTTTPREPRNPPPDDEGRPAPSSSGEATSSHSNSEAASSSVWTLGRIDNRNDAPWQATSTREGARERAPSRGRSAAYSAAASTGRTRSAAYSAAASTGRARIAARAPTSRSRADVYRAIEAAWRAALEATGIAGIIGVAGAPDHGTSGMNVEAAVKHLRDHSGAVAIGLCARRVREAIEAGKIKLNLDLVETHRYGNELTRFAKDYGPALKAAGFVEVAESATLGRYRPKAGDVVVFGGFPNHDAGHMAMYDGQEWVSDFKQGSKVKRLHDGEAGNGFYVNNNDHFVGKSFVIYRP